jgi:hypothetical protein
MQRVAAIMADFVLAPTAAANIDVGPKPFPTVTSAPTNLHAFLLRPDEAGQKYYPRTPSFAWSPVGKREGSYEFELATSRSFNESAVLFSYTNLKMPAASVAHQVPFSRSSRTTRRRGRRCTGGCVRCATSTTRIS